MCYWVGSRKVREVLLKQLGKEPENEIAQLFYRTFIDPPKPENALTLMEHPVAIGKAKPTLTTLVNAGEGLTFKNMEWTLQWKYFDGKTKQEKWGRPLLNSRSENVFWQHKDLIYTRRCLIPVDGYWEYYHFKGQTYPVFIYPKNGELFYLGGIWNQMVHESTGEKVESFSIITTPPNEITKKLHNNPKAHDGPRMLLVVDEKACADFLNPQLQTRDIQERFFKPLESSKMNYHPTVRFLKREFADYLHTEKVQQPFTYPELSAS